MLLRPRATALECMTFCETARDLHVAAICVPPTHVEHAAATLSGSDVKVVALISHPFGADHPAVKAAACRQAIAAGAADVEVVCDLSRFASGDPNYVRDELRRCVAASREARSEALVRAVIETGAFDDRTLRLLARTLLAAEVDMLVTSSGLQPEATDVLDVELMREEVGADMGIKAVRAVREPAEIRRLVAAGATRVGAPTADALLPAR